MSLGSDIQGKTDQPSVEELPIQPAALSSATIPYLLSTVDAFIILLASVTGGICYQWSMGYQTANIFPYCAIGLLASFIHILRMSGSGYYDFADSARPRLEITEVLVCWFTTGLLLAFFAFLLKISVVYSRGAFLVFYLLAPVGLLGARKLTKRALASAISRGTVGRRDIVLIGDLNEIAAWEPKDLWTFFGAADVNHFTLSNETDALVRTSADLRTVNLVANFVRQHACGEILLALPWGDAGRLEFIREHMKALPISVRLLPDMRVRTLMNYASSTRQRVLAIEIQRAPLSGGERLVKRGMDLILASAALTLFMPLMILTTVAIKLDGRGPIIFRQNRKGFNGRQFVMFKFRTMVVQENGPAVAQATRDDPRVTPIGRLLRAASIDELPQLLNVLKGDMSLIGPRPHALAHDNYFERILGDYAFRHHVKPGITGWAQCNGSRGATPSVEHISERVKLDLWYINNWSLWLDIHILIKTAFEVLRRRNAY
jgi:undecaprenyl-phosphate galactose phosphotransferase/putative colanic acid biosynthesis UDP-glucose lipid carrier transferase